MVSNNVMFSTRLIDWKRGSRWHSAHWQFLSTYFLPLDDGEMVERADFFCFLSNCLNVRSSFQWPDAVGFLLAARHRLVAAAGAMLAAGPGCGADGGSSLCHRWLARGPLSTGPWTRTWGLARSHSHAVGIFQSCSSLTNHSFLKDQKYWGHPSCSRNVSLDWSG